MRRILAIAATVVLGVVAVAGPASAESNGGNLGPAQRLIPEGFNYDLNTGDSTPNAEITPAWTTGSDSPTDAGNTLALRVTIPAATATEAYYADAYSKKSLDIRKPVARVTNLSFEFANDESFGGGAPRISVQFLNGDVGYLSAEYCDNHLAVKPSWSRADFTGRKLAGCSMLVTGDTGGTYSSDGTHSAFQNYALANPDQVLDQAYMVWDAPGTYSVDRIALGAGKLYSSSNTKGVNCGNENSC